MPGGSRVSIGNTLFSQSIYASLTPAASVGNASSSTSTYTINGLLQYDLIDLYPQSALTTTLSLGSIWVSAANTLSIQWINSTAGTSTGSPAAISFIILVTRAEPASQGAFSSSNWPTGIE